MAHRRSVILSTGITAHSGGGNASAVLLGADALNIVSTSAAHGDSVILPLVPIGRAVTVKNSGAKDVAVFPPAGFTIDSLAANVAYQLSSGSTQLFVASSTTAYVTRNKFKRYVYRSPTSVDFSGNGSINTNTSVYNDLNLSAIVSPSCYGNHVDMRMWTTDAGGDTPFNISCNASAKTNTNCVDKIYIDSYPYEASGCGMVGPTDSSGCIYLKPGDSFTNIKFTVAGWEAEG